MKTILHNSITALFFALAAFACSHAVAADRKPLKVFILAGQSNMEGHAKVETFDYINPSKMDHGPSRWLTLQYKVNKPQNC